MNGFHQVIVIWNSVFDDGSGSELGVRGIAEPLSLSMRYTFFGWCNPADQVGWFVWWMRGNDRLRFEAASTPDVTVGFL